MKHVPFWKRTSKEVLRNQDLLGHWYTRYGICLEISWSFVGISFICSRSKVINAWTHAFFVGIGMPETRFYADESRYRSIDLSWVRYNELPMNCSHHCNDWNYWAQEELWFIASHTWVRVLAFAVTVQSYWIRAECLQIPPKQRMWLDAVNLITW